MPPKRLPSTPDRDGLPTTDHMDRLCAAVETLAGEMKLIRELIDRVLDDFAWALNNDKLKPDCCQNLAVLVDRALELEEIGTADATDDRRDEPTPTVTQSAAPVLDPRARPEQRDLFS